MNIILAALAFAMIFYGATALVRMAKAVRASDFLSPIGGGYGVGWFSTLILLNVIILIAMVVYYRYKRRSNIGAPGPKGYEGPIGQDGI